MSRAISMDLIITAIKPLLYLNNNIAVDRLSQKQHLMPCFRLTKGRIQRRKLKRRRRRKKIRKTKIKNFKPRRKRRRQK